MGLFDSSSPVEFTEPKPAELPAAPAAPAAPAEKAEPIAATAEVVHEKKERKKGGKKEQPLTIDVKPEEPTSNVTLSVLTKTEGVTRPTLFGYLKEHLGILARLDALSDAETPTKAAEDAILKEVGELGAALQANDENLDRKILGWAAWIVGMDLDATQLESVIQRLETRRARLRACERAARATLCVAMDVTEHNRVTAPEWTVYTQASPDSIHIENPEWIPIKFIKDPPPPADRIDKRALLDAINSGATPIPPGVTIKKGRHVRIK